MASTSSVKMESKARDAATRRATELNRDILALILRHLCDHGYIDTYQRLASESGWSLEKIDIVDNINLNTILIDYESYFQDKYNKRPKITKIKTLNSEQKIELKKKLTKSSIKNKIETKDDELIEITGKNIKIQNETILNNNLEGNKAAVQNTILEGEYQELAKMIEKDIQNRITGKTWEDIHISNGIKNIIKEALILPLKYPQYFNDKIKPYKSILLYGPSGTGKTTLAKAAALEMNYTFFNVSSSTLISKWRGESEKLIRVLFMMLQYRSPSILFIDEVDGLMCQRGSESEHESSRRMKTELLIRLDEILESSNLNIIIITSTNRPWELDMAFLRRMDRKVYVPLPCREDRENILKCNLKDRTSCDVDFGEMADLTCHYSGSDLMVLSKEASMRPLRRLLNNETNDKIMKEDIIKSIEVIKATTIKDLSKFEQFQNLT